MASRAIGHEIKRVGIRGIERRLEGSASRIGDGSGRQSAVGIGVIGVFVC